jgi:outer membrane immunogenic protein
MYAFDRRTRLQKALVAGAVLVVLFFLIGYARAEGIKGSSSGIGVADSGFNWTGFYVGIHGGVPTDASTVYTYTVSGNYEPAGRPRPTEPDGWLAGGHIGYLWQFGQIVAGIEGSATYTDMSDVLRENPPPRGNDYRTSTETGPIYMATGRLGVAWNRLLAYGKAGWAWTEFDFQATFHNRDGPYHSNGSVVKISNTFHENAPVYGAGLEYALSQNLSLGLEYMRMDFGTSDVVTLKTTNSGITTEKLRASHEIDTVTARLNFKF